MQRKPFLMSVYKKATWQVLYCQTKPQIFTLRNDFKSIKFQNIWRVIEMFKNIRESKLWEKYGYLIWIYDIMGKYVVLLLWILPSMNQAQFENFQTLCCLINNNLKCVPHAF